MAARGGHAPSPVPPNHKSVTVDPIQHRARQEKGKRGRHERQRAKGSLVRAGHAPNTDDRRGQCFQRLDQTTTGNAAEGRVLKKATKLCRSRSKN
jgi:hypothetical protein